MTIHDIAKRLHELCIAHDYDTAYAELFSQEAENIEPPHAQGMGSVKGIEAILAKTKQFNSMIEEVHSSYAHEPKVFGPYIFMEMGMNATFTGMGSREMNEMCKYEVKNGKIISEEFFY